MRPTKTILFQRQLRKLLPKEYVVKTYTNNQIEITDRPGKKKPALQGYVLWIVPIALIVPLVMEQQFLIALGIFAAAATITLFWQKLFPPRPFRLLISKQKQTILLQEGKDLSKVDFDRSRWFEIIVTEEKSGTTNGARVIYYSVQLAAIVEQDILLNIYAFNELSWSIEEAKAFAKAMQQGLRFLSGKKVFVRNRAGK